MAEKKETGKKKSRYALQPLDRSERAVREQRSYEVYKQNDAIRKARYDLNLVEFKIVNYIISKIKPEDTEDKVIEFDVAEFCKVCDINVTGGGVYDRIEATIQTLANKSWWIGPSPDKRALIRWINDPVIDKTAKKITFTIGRNFAPYVFGLAHSGEGYTRYQLQQIIYFSSKYSGRVYELLKSYAPLHHHTFRIEELLDQLQCPEAYRTYKYFKRRVLDVAVDEINKYTDLEVMYRPIKEMRSYTKIEFHIRQLGALEQMEKDLKIREERMESRADVPGQINMYSRQFVNTSVEPA